MPILINFLLGIFVLVSLLLILMVLMQRPKSEGLGAAFGGGMTENLFGAQTTNVLANFTRYLGGTFFGLALLLSILYSKQSQQKSAIQQELIKTAKPVTSGTNATGEEAIKNVLEAAMAKKSLETTGSNAASPAPAAEASPVSATSGKTVLPPGVTVSSTPTPKAHHSPSPAPKKPQ